MVNESVTLDASQQKNVFLPTIISLLKIYPHSLNHNDDSSYSYDLSVKEVFESTFEFETTFRGGFNHESFACVFL